MQNVNAISIGTEQIEYLATQTDLGITEHNMRQILEFRMPTLDEIKKYKKQNQEDFEVTVYLERAYHYCQGYTTHLQRRLIRYIALLLAMRGQIKYDNSYQIIQDLMETDIDLEDSESIKSGWERVKRAFSNTFQKFSNYEEDITCLSNYDMTFPSQCDYEGVQSEKLCCDAQMMFVSKFLKKSTPDIYVEPTSNQRKAIEERIKKGISNFLNGGVDSSKKIGENRS